MACSVVAYDLSRKCRESVFNSKRLDCKHHSVQTHGSHDMHSLIADQSGRSCRLRGEQGQREFSKVQSQSERCLLRSSLCRTSSKLCRQQARPLACDRLLSRPALARNACHSHDRPVLHASSFMLLFSEMSALRIPQVILC